MVKKINFNKTNIEALPIPEKDKRLTVHDTKVRGLICRITHTGIKTFNLVRRTKNGRMERITLGKYPDLSCEQARNEAEKINASIAQGGSPAQVRKAHRNEFTFEELFYEFLEKHSKIHKTTWRQDESNYKCHLKTKLGKKRLSEVTKMDISAVHQAIVKQTIGGKMADGKAKFKSASTANHVLVLVKTVFNWANKNEISQFNPTKGIKKFKVTSRDRFLLPEEMSRFFAALDTEKNSIMRDFFYLLLYTGARRSNVQAMAWTQICFVHNEWRIPKTKNGLPHLVPLSVEAVEILKKAKEKRGNYAYVFPGDGGAGHIVSPKKAWKNILKRAEIENLRMHDLRRTMGSWQAKTGASLIVIGKTLGHLSQQSTSIYARLDLDPVRQSIAAATSAMRQTVSSK